MVPVMQFEPYSLQTFGRYRALGLAVVLSMPIGAGGNTKQQPALSAEEQ